MEPNYALNRKILFLGQKNNLLHDDRGFEWIEAGRTAEHTSITRRNGAILVDAVFQAR